MISLKELVKKKIAKPPSKKEIIGKSKGLFVGCVSIFYNDQGYIFIAYANRVLANYGKAQF